jgi:carboxyl-terminal processing protease
MNAISQIYDPHTDFYAPKDKENFDIQLSGQLEGIGATLTQKDGYIKVAAIVPGSPSYKQGQLKAEDIILKVAQAENEPIDVVDMKLDQAIKLIRGKKGTLVKLTVKKPDGSIVIIPIVRDVVIIEDTYAKSVILKGGNMDERVGYIYLPSFYADFSNQRGGRTCFEDVRKEVEKLKQEKVDGIVLDLRNNGGGSLGDVVKMAGLFIPSGPIVQVKGRDSAPTRLNDDDSRVQYEGPLVIMVNTFSASASEIMAAAMQDYKRAIIVGSEHTYGKGTVQRIFDLDQALSGTYASLKPFGSVKLTTQKFYRINGGTTQLKGVVPDIVLPDLYKYVKVGEKELEKVMPWDQITPAFYKEYPRSSTFVDKLKDNSLKRQKDNPTFQQIEAAALRLKTRQDQTKFTLNLEKYREEQKKIQAEEQKLKDATKTAYDTEVFTLIADEDPEADEAKTERKKAFKDNLKKDVYIYEVLQILHDMNKVK